jgi:hypothetical protein
VLAVLSLTTVVVVPPSAQARTSHNFESAITEVPAVGPHGAVALPGPFEPTESLTVHSGDLYVAEPLEAEGIAGNAARTDEFGPVASEPGKYEFLSQLPVQPEPNEARYDGIGLTSAGAEQQMYIGQQNRPGGKTGVNSFTIGACGTLECANLQTLWTGAQAPSPFADVRRLAVDPSTAPGDWASGDVFVSEQEPGQNVIDIFEPVVGGGEKYVAQVTGPSPSEKFTSAIKSSAISGFNGDLVVATSLTPQEGVVDVLRPEEEGPKKGKYSLVTHLTPPGGSAALANSVRVVVAIDGDNGEIYVATAAAIFEFGPDGTFLGEIAGVPKEGVAGGAAGDTEEVAFSRVVEPQGLAIDPVSHRLFAAVAGESVGPHGEHLSAIDVFGPDVVVPDVATEGPANLTLETNPETGSGAWAIKPFGTVDPDEAGEATCFFAWGTSEALEHEAPCTSSVSNGGTPTRVHANLTGLEPDTTYFYRLEARNTRGTNPGEATQDYRFTTPGPGLRSESASNVAATSATFESAIAPHDAPIEEHDFQEPAKAPTSYYFQYSAQPTDDCFAEPALCVSVPSSPVNIGAGATDVNVEQHLAGLSPNTTYHYRVVAVNEPLPASHPGVLTAFYGPDRNLSTQGPGGPLLLPDGREWELVSPANKHGAKVVPAGHAATDGAGFAFLTQEPTEAGAPGNISNGDQVLASRVAPGSWSSVDVELSHSSVIGVPVGLAAEYRFFSEDLGLGVAESIGPFSVPEGFHQNTRGEWQRVVEASPLPSERTPYLRHNTTCPTEPSTCFEPLLDSEDVTSGEKLEGKPAADEGAANVTAATPDARHALITSTVRLTASAPAGEGLYEWSAEAPPAQRLSFIAEATEGLALSTDGRRVFFGECRQGCREIGVRDLLTSETARLDLTESGSPPLHSIAFFAGASADGTKAFFTDVDPLTKRSGEEDLYACSLPQGPGALRCALTDLTPIPALGQPGAGESADVSRVVDVSHDGSYVYFLAKGVLAAGASPGENLYVAHESGGMWTTSFIAPGAGFAPVITRTASATPVSPDGQLLAFASDASLTGYDNRDARTGAPDDEMYLYDAPSEKLSCVSCDASGARPIGAAKIPPSATARALFDDGRLFFDSADALVPQDTNENTDVYEYEPPGVGSCTPTSPTFNVDKDGCVALISSGVAPEESTFLDASATGGDVFFVTAGRLVPADTDSAMDVYDAHECTAESPCAGAGPAAPEECVSLSTCRPAPSAQPSIFGAPASATFFGPANLAPVASPPAPAPKPQTPAQLRAKALAKALRVCRRRHGSARRACERRARARYGPARSSRSARNADHHSSEGGS